MILFPAIDLKDGQCVRLQKGDMDKVTVFNEDVAAQAQLFQSQGFEWLHLVDLNGAFAGHSANSQAVEKIIAAVSLPVQLGGGLRDLAGVERWLTAGVKRVILGTAAVKNPGFVREACRAFPGQVAVGIDARNGFVAVEGWAETSTLKDVELAQQFEDAGVAALIYTDIDRDGMLEGLNFDRTLALAQATSIPVIASGGLASMADIETLASARYRPLAGAISGRALYDGRIDIPRALALLKAA